MQSLLGGPQSAERSRGVQLLAGLFALGSIASLMYAVLLWRSAVAFTAGAWLVGVETARMGPSVYLVFAVALVACSVGLLWKKMWARWLAIFILGWGFVQLVPVVSAAVITANIPGIAKGI